MVNLINKYFFSTRSTPRRDAVYGGQDDLTAAIGWEEDGVTTVIFRKPASGAQVCFMQYRQSLSNTLILVLDICLIYHTLYFRIQENRITILTER